MSTQSMIILLIFFAISYLFAFKFLKKMWRIIGLCVITGILVGIIALAFLYFSNHAYKLTIDARLQQSHYYVDLSNDNKLPLPDNTALSFRKSEKSATFFTTKSEEEIIKYYKGISNVQSLKIVARHELYVTENGQNFKIIIEETEQPRGNYLQVESQ